ncbi:MAG: hypothetical protein ACREP9_14510, partial [Candidatus Dormibacteraceae bacterium]
MRNDLHWSFDNVLSKVLRRMALQVEFRRPASELPFPTSGLLDRRSRPDEPRLHPGTDGYYK